MVKKYTSTQLKMSGELLLKGHRAPPRFTEAWSCLSSSITQRPVMHEHTSLLHQANLDTLLTFCLHSGETIIWNVVSAFRTVRGDCDRLSVTNTCVFLWWINTEARTCGSLHFIGKKNKNIIWTMQQICSVNGLGAVFMFRPCFNAADTRSHHSRMSSIYTKHRSTVLYSPAQPDLSVLTPTLRPTSDNTTVLAYGNMIQAWKGLCTFNLKQALYYRWE